jgi:hypothetical protein
VKVDFIVVTKNSQDLLDLVEWLHCNPSHYRKFECSALTSFVVVLVYEGDYEALKYSSTKGTIVVIPHNGGEVR